MVEWVLVILLKVLGDPDAPLVLDGFSSEKKCLAAGKVITDRYRNLSGYKIPHFDCLKIEK